MILSVDIGNTHTNLGVGNLNDISRTVQVPTNDWGTAEMDADIRRLIGRRRIDGVAIASVVPVATAHATTSLRQILGLEPVLLSHKNVVGLGIDYPKPSSIGADRLANAMAAVKAFGAPVVVVDFGTAVTFDVVDKSRCYVGGIIAPGLSAMTDYLHEKTALLPRVRIRDPKRCIGKSTKEAMLIGAVKGYRGLISSLIDDIKSEMNVRRLRVVATGGYADLIAKGLPQVSCVDRNLTLEGLRLLAIDCFGLSESG